MACGIWLGMLILLGFGVAPVIFTFMDSKTQAGLLNGIILHRMNIAEGVCACIIVSSSVIFLLSSKTKFHLLRLLVSALLLASLGYYSLVITPRMNELKRTIQSFDIPKTLDTSPEREEFDRLHTLYSSLVSVNAALLMVLSFMIAMARKQDQE